MFGRRKQDYIDTPIDVPFDEDSYVPEPTRHFDNAISTQGAMVGAGILIYGAYRLLVYLGESGFFESLR